MHYTDAHVQNELMAETHTIAAAVAFNKKAGFMETRVSTHISSNYVDIEDALEETEVEYCACLSLSGHEGSIVRVFFFFFRAHDMKSRSKQLMQ